MVVEGLLRDGGCRIGLDAIEGVVAVAGLCSCRCERRLVLLI